MCACVFLLLSAAFCGVVDPSIMLKQETFKFSSTYTYFFLIESRSFVVLLYPHPLPHSNIDGIFAPSLVNTLVVFLLRS